MRGRFIVFALPLAALLLLPRPAAAVLPSAVVTARQPAPQARLRTFYPLISASIGHAAAADVHVFLDGKDVTSFVGRQGNRVQYVPRDRVSPGWHDVFVAGTGADGRRFSDAWAFQTLAPDADWDDTTPTWFWYGGFLHFFFIAPDDGFAVLQLCNLGTYPFQHFPGSPVFLVTVPYSPFSALSNCEVTAFFTPLAGGQTQYFPLGIAGPGISKRGTVTPGVRSDNPLYRSPPIGSAAGTTIRSLPAAGVQPQMIVVPGARTIPAVHSAVPHVTIPHASVPHTTIPHP